MCRVQTAAPLRPVSASTLVSTTGGHFPASLCLCYGKRTRSPAERNWQTITLGGKEAKMQWADCKYRLGEGKKGLNREGEAKLVRTSSGAASVQKTSAFPSLRLQYLCQLDFSFRCKMKGGWVKAKIMFMENHFTK